VIASEPTAITLWGSAAVERLIPDGRCSLIGERFRFFLGEERSQCLALAVVRRMRQQLAKALDIQLMQELVDGRLIGARRRAVILLGDEGTRVIDRQARTA